jgi:hypothetical protein
MLRGALFAALLSCVASTAHAELGRDDQWIYHPATAEHGARAELRGDSSAGPATELIFQVECLRAERTLLFRFDAWDGLSAAELDRQMSLLLGDDGEVGVVIPTSRDGVHLLGRLALTGRLASAVRDARYVTIYAPNDMDEAFHAGEAPALKRLTRECWERT